MTEQEYIQARRSEPWREELRKTIKAKERGDIPPGYICPNSILSTEAIP